MDKLEGRSKMYTTNERLKSEVTEANLSYLVLAQRLLRMDRTCACYQLGVSDVTAAILESLTPSQMVKIANRNMLLCRVRFEDEKIWTTLSKADGLEGDKGVYANILMATAEGPALGS